MTKLDFMKWEIMESGKKIMKELHTIEFKSIEELMDFLEFLTDAETQICLTKSQLHEAYDYAWEAWATEKKRTRDDKIAVAQFARALTRELFGDDIVKAVTDKLFGDDKTEKEEN